MIWRDTWDGTPGVVVITEQAEEDGQLDAVLLGLRLDTLPATAHITNEHGRALRVHLPRDVDAFSLNTRITLTVEVTT
ncbi:hypothetical protein GCM10008959_25160 [Deinococcus seoulensis]|uniref:Uncharacterized protein n=1 Tax=Deinococcus seoulensis TaxID=1837379 RepID=A0ABQ2RSR3_9DEIO|nr:hypothetical protein [Deinococcus seoulensis]GGR62184.1 hypothetical protein GCM10008959_25160 [Deinococcus seoulensis]